MGGLNGEGGAAMRGCATELGSTGPPVLSPVELAEMPYEAHLRAVCLQNERGEHLSTGSIPIRQGSLPGVNIPAFWGCTCVSPELVSAGTPCCSVRHSTAGMEGYVLQPR